MAFFAGDFAAFTAGVFDVVLPAPRPEPRAGVRVEPLPDVPFRAAFFAGAFLAGAFLAGAFLAGAFLAAVFFAGDFFVAPFLAAGFFAGERFAAPAAFRADDFFAGARFAVPAAFRADVFFGADFLPAAFFAGAFLPAAFFAPALVAVPLRAAFPAAFFAAAFDVAFFTLFFPAAFLVVLLALRDALADLVGFFPFAGFTDLADFADFAGLALPGPALPDRAAPAFAAFAAFLTPDRPAPDFAVVFPRATFFFPDPRAGPFLAAGGRTVATRAARAAVVSDCSACPAFDLACEAMLTSRNAGMGILPGWFLALSRAPARKRRRAASPDHRRSLCTDYHLECSPSMLTAPFAPCGASSR